MVTIEKKVLSENDLIAARLREWLREKGALAVNLISSPGSGKTTLLEKTLEMLPLGTRAARFSPATFRPTTMRAAWAAMAIQCGRSPPPAPATWTRGWWKIIWRIGPDEPLDLLLIENVGNLVCPTSYDLGEDAKIVVLSVTEGEDKPLKYPGIFRKAELMILNKIDLLPYVPFDPALAIQNARRIHPEIAIIETSCTAGAGLGHIGLDQWLKWLAGRAVIKKAALSAEEVVHVVV